MAVKIIKDGCLTPHVINMIKLEANLLNSFDHPKFRKIFHLLRLHNKYYMALEYF